LAAERYEVRFTASAETLAKLRTAQDLLGHAVPNGDLAQVVDRALTLLVADLERKKFAATSRPRMSVAASNDDSHIPAVVRRGVAARDGGRCAFVSRSGRRCGERRFLEFHHIVPLAAGGRATIENIELRCRSHNGYAVDEYFGRGKRRARGGSRCRHGSQESTANSFRNKLGRRCLAFQSVRKSRASTLSSPPPPAN
jgi:hypothetical protein